MWYYNYLKLFPTSLKTILKLVDINLGQMLVIIVVGFLLWLPQILLVTQLGHNYKGIIFQKTDADFYYLSRVREAFEGKVTLSSPSLFEYKHEPAIVGFVSEQLLGRSADIVNISPPLFHWLTIPIVSSVILTLAVIFARTLGFNRWSQIATALLCCVTPELITSPYNLLSPSESSLVLSRPVHPNIDAIFFWIGLISSVKILQKNSPKLLILLGVCAGIMWWMYVYYAVFLSVIWLLVVVRWLLVNKNKTNCIWGIISFLGLFFPYLLSILKLKQHPLYEITAPRVGLIHSNNANISWLVILLLLLFVGVVKKNQQPPYILVLFTLFGYIVVTNQQLLTSMSLQPGHWTWLLLPFTVTITGFYIISQTVPKLTTLFSIVLVLLSLGKAGHTQLTNYYQYKPYFSKLQQVKPVINWLQDNAQPESVVLAPELKELITTYSHMNLYSSEYDHFSLTPLQRLQHNVFVEAFLKGVTAKQSRQYFYDNRREISYYIYGMYYRECCGFYAAIPHTLLNDLDSRYQLFLSEVTTGTPVNRYRLDYVVVDKHGPYYSPVLANKVFESADYLVFTKVGNSPPI